MQPLGTPMAGFVLHRLLDNCGRDCVIIENSKYFHLAFKEKYVGLCSIVFQCPTSQT